MRPTVGAKVWFRRKGLSPDLQPYDATVVYVITDNSVSLIVNDHRGKQFYVNACFLWGNDLTDRPYDIDYCEQPSNAVPPLVISGADLKIEAIEAKQPWEWKRENEKQDYLHPKILHKKRLKDEAGMLETRLRSINSFMATSEWLSCSDAERELMLRQRRAMQKYHRALKERIELIP